MVPGRFSWFFMVPGHFSWFQVDFHGSKSVFMVPGQFSWFLVVNIKGKFSGEIRLHSDH